MKEEHICPDPFADKVKCYECKLWTDKTDASKVSGLGMFGLINDWYCPTHKKPYTRIIRASPNSLYFGEVLMEEDGTPVGYQKIKPK